MAFQRNPQIEAAPMQSETMLFNPGSNQFCLLNATAAFVWSHLESANAPGQLAEKMCESFAKSSVEQTEEDVLRVLQELQSLGFVQSM